jgi:hypothetical protein
MTDLTQSSLDNLPNIHRVPSVAKMVADILNPHLQSLEGNQFNCLFDNNYLAILTLTSTDDLQCSLEKLLTLKSGELSGSGIILIPFNLPTRELASLVWPLARFSVRIISSEEADLAQHALRLMMESEQRLKESIARW